MATLSEPNGRMQVSRSESPAIIRVVFVGGLDPKTVTAGIPASGADPNNFTFLVENKGQYPQNVVPGTIPVANGSQAQFRFQDGPFPVNEYTVTLVGTEGQPAPVKRPTIRSTGDSPLDGEPTQLPSGDGTPGGNFVFTFSVN